MKKLGQAGLMGLNYMVLFAVREAEFLFFAVYEYRSI